MTISLKEADEKPNHGLQTLRSFTGLFYECVDNIEESIIPFNSMNDNMNNAKQKRRTTVLLLKWIHHSSSRQIIRLEQSLLLNNYVFQWSNNTTPNHHSLFSLINQYCLEWYKRMCVVFEIWFFTHLKWSLCSIYCLSNHYRCQIQW